MRRHRVWVSACFSTQGRYHDDPGTQSAVGTSPGQATRPPVRPSGSGSMRYPQPCPVCPQRALAGQRGRENRCTGGKGMPAAAHTQRRVSGRPVT